MNLVCASEVERPCPAIAFRLIGLLQTEVGVSYCIPESYVGNKALL